MKVLGEVKAQGAEVAKAGEDVRKLTAEVSHNRGTLEGMLHSNVDWKPHSKKEKAAG